jgi:hypothetical protein
VPARTDIGVEAPLALDLTGDFGLGIHAFGVRIAILTDNEEVRQVLNRYTLPWLPRVAAKPHSAHAVFRVTADGDGSTFNVFGNGLVEKAAGLMAVVPALQRLMDEAIIHGQTHLAAIHAGVVAAGGAAVLLPGVSHAGKSSLVAELLRRGAVYFSDEYALLDTKGRVHPYPRALMLRNGRPQQQPALPGEFHAKTANSAADIRLILAVQYDPAGVWAVNPVSQSEGLLILLRNTPHVLAESPWILGPLRQASAGAVCYEGVRGDAGEAAATILNWLRERP